jgi:hypothetical protein
METHKIAYQVILRESDFSDPLLKMSLVSRFMDYFRREQKQQFVHEWTQGSEKRWRDENLQRGPSYARHEQVVVDDSVIMRYRITVVLCARPAHMEYMIRHLEDTRFHMVRERITGSNQDSRFFDPIQGDSFSPVVAASRESYLSKRLN